MPEIIRQGDSTSHGGTVVEGSLTDICHGKPIAFIGHKVQCPQCGGIYPIVEGVMTTSIYGKGVAVAGMKTSCGATLIPSQFTDIVEYAGGSSGASTGAAAAANAFLAAAPAALASMGRAANTPGKEKTIKRISWTYGPDEVPLSNVSRHYVDLNLHVETENYVAGETVLVTVENDDGSEIVAGSKAIQLEAVVGANGQAKLMNAFATRTVEIGTIA